MKKDLVNVCVKNFSAGKIDRFKRRNESLLYCFDYTAIRFYGNVPAERKCKKINEYVAIPTRSILKGYHITWNWDASHCEVKTKKVPKEAQ